MFNDSRAYDPFYSDVCQYTAKRPHGRTLRASVACNVDDGGLDDVNSEMSSASNIRVVYVSIRPSVWPWKKSHEPQIGDEVEVKTISFSGLVETVAKGCDGSYLLTCKG